MVRPSVHVKSARETFASSLGEGLSGRSRAARPLKAADVGRDPPPGGAALCCGDLASNDYRFGHFHGNSLANGSGNQKNW